MQIYATPTELVEFMHGPDSSEHPPHDAHELLRRASELVLDETKTAIYATDDEGYPVDTAKRDAMRWATCAQAEAWLTANVRPGTLAHANDRQIASKSLGGRSVSYEANPVAVAERNALASGRVLVDSARAYLRRAGLLTTRVVDMKRGSTVG